MNAYAVSPGVASSIAAGVRKSLAPKPRWYQEDLKHQIYAAWETVDNVLAVMPTGAGKTITFASVVSEHVGASICIAHRSELIEQISMALAKFGVRHRIIGPEKLIRAICKQHLEELGVAYYDPNAKAGVASVQSMTPSRVKAEARWIAQVTKWVQDECFPAGTLIDGRPIEALRVGDIVTAFDPQTGQTEPREVSRLWKNPAPNDMVRLRVAHHVVECTFAHPIFTRRGWIAAGELLRSDEVLLDGMYDVQGAGSEPVEISVIETRENRTDLLLEKMQRSLHRTAQFRPDGRYQSQVRFGSDENQQSNGETWCATEDARHVDSDKTRAQCSGRQRQTADGCGGNSGDNPSRARICSSVQHQDRIPNWGERVPERIQARLGPTGIENSHRSGRLQPLCVRTPAPGPEKGRVLNWSRLDSVEVFQCRNPDGSYVGAHDGYVYNIEVEGLHTYLANGLVVHNCHHVLRENQWGKAALLFPSAKGLGVTATPCRADRKGLGRHASGVFDVLIKGPSMRELIELGYLTDYRVVGSVTHIDMAGVSLGSDGDYVLHTGKGKAAVRKSSLVGDVVETYRKWSLGKQAVIFVSDTDTSKDMAEQFRAAGVTAEHVDGMTDPDERRAIMRRYRKRETLVLSNVGLVSEGFDVPGIETVILAHKTRSFSKHAQQVGRALRLMIDRSLMARWDDMPVQERMAHIAASSKQKALVIDHVGSWLDPVLGAPDARNEWSLDDGEAPASNGPNDVIPNRYCLNPECLSPYSRALPCCPFCGVKPAPTPGRSGPEAVDGDMLEYDDQLLAALRDAVAKVAMPNDVFREQAHIRTLPSAWIGSNVKKHDAHRVAQAELQNAMAWWAGEQRAVGRSDAEVFRRFFLIFGHDWLSVQAQDRETMIKVTGWIFERLSVDTLLQMVDTCVTSA